MMCVLAWVTQRVRRLVTPQTAVHPAPLSMGFSRREDWSGLSFPSPGELPDPGLLHRRWSLYRMRHQGLPIMFMYIIYLYMTYIYICKMLMKKQDLNHFAVYQKWTQHSKWTNFNKINLNNKNPTVEYDLMFPFETMNSFYTIQLHLVQHPLLYLLKHTLVWFWGSYPLPTSNPEPSGKEQVPGSRPRLCWLSGGHVSWEAQPRPATLASQVS